MPKPIEGTYPAYFQKYIDQVSENDAITAITNQQNIVDDYFDNLPADKINVAYAPGKWTLKELLLHIIDTERIFIYRSLAFARGETQSLPSFDENNYAQHSNARARDWQSLCNEFKTVRKSTIALFESFTDETINASGLANNNPTTVNAMGFIIAGHLYHHKNIIEERYL